MQTEGLGPGTSDHTVSKMLIHLIFVKHPPTKDCIFGPVEALEKIPSFEKNSFQEKIYNSR